MFKLQSNVPVPKIVRPRGRGRRKYPFEAMQVGQFFFVPDKTREQLHGHVYAVGRQLKRKFIVRLAYMREVNGEWQPCEQTDSGATLGVGVWRTE